MRSLPGRSIFALPNYKDVSAEVIPGVSAAMPYRKNKVVFLCRLAHLERETIKKFVFENHDGVGIANGRLQ